MPIVARASARSRAVDGLEQGKRHALNVGDRQKGLGLSACQMEAWGPVKVGLAEGDGARPSRATAMRSIRPPIGSWKFMAPWFKALGARCKAETGRYSRGTFRKPIRSNGR